MPIRILVAEDLPIARTGIVGILQRDPLVTVIGEAQDPDETIEKCRSLHPDLVLLGVQLGQTAGAMIARVVVDSATAPRVLILSADQGSQHVRAMLEAGVSAYLPASITPQELLIAIRQVMRGGQVLLDRATASGGTAHPHLSTQELVVLKAVSAGSSTKEIALRLGCSPRTVETYVQRIFDKLGARSRAQAVSIANQDGLL